MLSPRAPRHVLWQRLTGQLLCVSAGFLWLLLLNAFTAYFQNLSNFLVTKATSPLTLQV